MIEEMPALEMEPLSRSYNNNNTADCNEEGTKN